MMRLTTWITTGMLLLTGPAMAQLMYPAYSDSAIRHSVVEVDGILDIQGTSLRREFSNTLLFGGFIDNGMKDRSFEKHGEINRFGVNVNTEVRYINGSGNFLKRDSVAWMVKAGYVAIGNLNYGKDVFGMLFYGNQSYLGATADFTNTRLDFAQFQKIGFGIVNKKDKSSITLNFVNVQNYLGGTIRRGELKENADGSQVDLDIAGQMRTTQGTDFSKGAGLSLDVDYRIRVPWGKTHTTIQISAQNIGFAYMYNGLVQYKVDSNYTYSGFRFNQLTGGSAPLGSDSFSVLDSLGIGKSTVKRVIALPGYIQVAKLVDLQSAKKVQSFFGLRMYPTFSSIPQVFGGAYWKTCEKLHLSAALTYGGFGNFRGGLYATLNLDRVSWMIGTEDVYGAVSKSGFGESVVTRLLWKIN